MALWWFSEAAGSAAGATAGSAVDDGPLREHAVGLTDGGGAGAQAPPNAMSSLAEVLNAHRDAHPSATAHNRPFYLALPHEYVLCSPPTAKNRRKASAHRMDVGSGLSAGCGRTSATC